MRTLIVAFVAATLLGCTGSGTDPDSEADGGGNDSAPVVIVQTNLGAIEIELYPDKAPTTVENFLQYVDDEFYDGTVFHRVIEDFMIQGGGYDTDENKKPTREPVKNEADNGLKNTTGTVAMARTSVPDSATSQFFINVADNEFLDFKSATPTGYGYAVFGKVVSGIDVVETIETAPIVKGQGAFKQSPEETVVIETIRRK
jgi:peptidyl-prolyl cis-trans isomerase A (cyclophilin A)/peptidyl-prolyl cis-trans isomerase B (cyclophilin B)